MKIYTRGGDRGETSLFGGERVAKDHPRVECYGTIDELNSFVGVARAHCGSSLIAAELANVQSDLFEIGAHLAAPASARFPGVNEARILDLERGIDTMERSLEPLKNFILPGGSVAAAHLHVARTVCRRAERLVVAMHETAELEASTIPYLNRLSDFLFVAARFANHSGGSPDIEWRGGRGTG